MKRLLVFFALAAPMLFAVDDVLPKGALQITSVFRVLEAENYLDYQGDPQGFNSTENYEDQYADIRMEMGWEARITMIMETTWRRRTLDMGDGLPKNTGVPGVYMGMKQRITALGNGARFLTETGVFIPVEAKEDESLPLGSGGIDWDLIGSYGQDFYPTSGGFEMDFGYRFRNGRPDDEILFNTRLKLDLRRVARAILAYRVVESTEDRQQDYDPLVYPQDRGSQTISLDFERNVGVHWRVGLGYEEVLEARNLFDTSGYRVSVTWRR